MIKTITRYVEHLYTQPPKKIVRKIRRKFSSSLEKPYTIDDVIDSQKIMRPSRPFDFLNRYQLILKQNVEWAGLDFQGKHVLEIGCGPLFGYGPLAVFLGCSTYTCVEPVFNESVAASPVIFDKYFSPMHDDLSAIFGARCSKKQFGIELAEKVRVLHTPILDAKNDQKIDIILSNSCLEHIFPLEESLCKMKEMSAPGCQFLHTVDFGNHRQTSSPFEGMYEIEPWEYYKKFGKHINLYKASQLQNLLEREGFQADVVPYYFSKEKYSGKICSFWKEKFSEEELFLKTAILAGKLTA